MEVIVLNKQGKATTKKVKLDSGIFGIKPSDHAIYLDVKQYLASNRQGTGSNANSLRTNGADGGMGPLKIYNRALTSTEVKQNYTAMKGRYK